MQKNFGFGGRAEWQVQTELLPYRPLKNYALVQASPYVHHYITSGAPRTARLNFSLLSLRASFGTVKSLLSGSPTTTFGCYYVAHHPSAYESRGS